MRMVILTFLENSSSSYFSCKQRGEVWLILQTSYQLETTKPKGSIKSILDAHMLSILYMEHHEILIVSF